MKKRVRSGNIILSMVLCATVFFASILMTACSMSDEEQTANAASEPAAAGESALAQKEETSKSQNRNNSNTAAEVKTDQKGRIFFDLPIHAFISQYNSHCTKNKNGSLLPDAGDWSIYTSEQGIHSDYPALSYLFSNDEAPEFYPTMQINLSEDSGCVQEIAIYYDDHDYREETYREFENMCLYSIKSLYPKADSRQLLEFVKRVNNCEIPAGREYEHGIIPSILYHKDGIGIYPYRRGWASMYFCLIPVTKDRLRKFEEQGTKLYKGF